LIARRADLDTAAEAVDSSQSDGDVKMRAWEQEAT
jgi:hypothetical protein